MVDEYMRDMTSPGMREWLLPPLGAGGTAPQQSRLVIHKFCGIAPRASTLRMDSPQALSRVMSHALFKKGILALIEVSAHHCVILSLHTVWFDAQENTPRRTLPTEILEVLFEILMGTRCARPVMSCSRVVKWLIAFASSRRSDETSVGEFAFATLMSESFVLPLVISAMSAAPFMVGPLVPVAALPRKLLAHPRVACGLQVSLTALEHLVRQLVQHPNNAMFFSVDPKVCVWRDRTLLAPSAHAGIVVCCSAPQVRWQSWFLPLLLPPPPSIVVAVTEHVSPCARR